MEVGSSILKSIRYFWNKLNNIFRISQKNCSFKHIVRSIPEVCQVESIKQHICLIKTISHASIEHYKYSKPLPPNFRTEMHFARRHVYKLKNVVVDSVTGICCNRSHCFQESYGSLRQILTQNTVFFSNAERFLSDRPVFIVKVTGYYHFLLEEIPRLLLIVKHFPDVRVLISSKAYSFIRDIIQELAIRGIMPDVEYIDNKRPLLLEEYVFAQATAYSGFVHSNDIAALRSAFLDKENRPSQDKCIYVTRRYSRRSLRNEEQIEALMSDFGIEVVILERLSIKDQICLFARTDLVIGLHGAGLSNIVWCSPDTKIIEIFTKSRFVDCYAKISSTLSLNYNPLFVSEHEVANIKDLHALKRKVMKLREE